MLQTLGLSEAKIEGDAFCYKRWVLLQTLGLSEAGHIVGRDPFATNVGCYKRWASPRPRSRGMHFATNVGRYKRWASPRPQFERMKEWINTGPYHRALGQQIFGYICEPPHEIPSLGEAQRL